MEVIEVGKQLTLETTGVSFILDHKQLRRLQNSGRQRPEERKYYNTFYALLALQTKAVDDPASRRIVVAMTPEPEKAEHCLTSVQLLLGDREVRTMVASLRSSNSEWIASDLSFLADLAMAHNVTRALVFIGSFHTVLE